MSTSTCRDERRPEAPLVEVACDACGAEDRRRRYALRRSWIVTCRACGFAFVSPRAPSPLLEAKLQSWAEQDVVDAERLRSAFGPDMSRVFRGYLRDLIRDGGRPGRILDVGCATGAFLHVAREEGWAAEGLEVGRASSSHARRSGLVVHTTSLFRFTPPPESYDAVALLEVIEHLEQPSAALARLTSWLKPGGLLLLTTPNYDSLYRRLCGAGWWVVNCEDEHIALFSPRTLRAALRRQGLVPVQERIRGFDPLGILTTLRGRSMAPPAGASGPGMESAAGYYEARRRRLSLKALLARLGFLTAAKRLYALSESAFSWPRSPLYGLGEQLVVIARKDQEVRP